jgi:hypothetical protein
VLVQSLSFGVVGPAAAIATDLREGVVDRFRSLPMSRSAYLIGNILAELVMRLRSNNRLGAPLIGRPESHKLETHHVGAEGAA